MDLTTKARKIDCHSLFFVKLPQPPLLLRNSSQMKYMCTLSTMLTFWAGFLTYIVLLLSVCNVYFCFCFCFVLFCFVMFIIVFVFVFQVCRTGAPTGTVATPGRCAGSSTFLLQVCQNIAAQKIIAFLNRTTMLLDIIF